MAHILAELMAERISAGLKRKALTTCSRWALQCRVMGQPYPGPWSFKHHPWLREMHDSKAEMNVGQKSAQMGYTEWALNVTFFNIDVKGVDCLYVLPAKTPDASDFSTGRFDPALEASPHLSRLFSDVKNIGHKRAGNTNLYVRGSRSRAGLKSIPTGLIILDEVDEMTQENIPLALERAAGQVEKQVLMISTPTMSRYGINKYFLQSTQEEFFFKCPHCGRRTQLIFPQCLVVTAEDLGDQKVKNSFLKCKECDNRLEHETKSEWLSNGIWVPQYTDRDIRGFHVNQLYSSTVKPADLALSYLRSLRDPADEQEFYNSKLGLPHVVASGQVTDAQLDSCIGSHKNGATPRGLVTMGVDVGKWLHFEIDEWTLPGYLHDTVDLNIQTHAKVIKFGKVQHFEELDRLMQEYGIAFCVIDAHPERRNAADFAWRFYKRVRLCFYGQGINGKQIHTSSEKHDEPTMTVDRTSWLDLSVGRFRRGKEAITLPCDINNEYREHIKALVRRYEKDKDGNPVGRYINGNNDDHYAHARNYAELALPFAANVMQPHDIGNIL